MSNFVPVSILQGMNHSFEELDRQLTAEFPQRVDSSKKHLAGIARDSAKLCRAMRSLGKKLSAFASDKSLPNDVKCRIWENVREETGIAKVMGKYLKDKYILASELDRHLPQNERLSSKEFFALDCMTGNLSRRNVPETPLSPEECAELLRLSRKHGKEISLVFARLKAQKTKEFPKV